MRKRCGRHNVYAHSRQKKTRSKIEQNWGAGAPARAKTVKILNKNSKKSIKNRPKKWAQNGDFFTTDAHQAHQMRIDAHCQKQAHGQP